MKRALILLGVVALAALVLGGTPVQAQAEFTAFSGTSAFDHAVTMGDWTTLPSGRIRVRGYAEAYLDGMTDERVSGMDTIVVNMDFDAQFAGPMWGTGRIENGGGYWEMTWIGERTSQGFSYVTMDGHGHGGYEGLRAKWQGQRLDPNPAAPWQFTGYILVPGAH